MHVPSDMPLLLRTLTGLIGPEMEPLKSWATAGVPTLGVATQSSQAWWQTQVSQGRRTALLRKMPDRDTVRLAH